jgi:hypothetical protein
MASWGQDNSVNYGLDGQELIPGMVFSLDNIIQTGSGAHSFSYSMGTDVNFPGHKTAEVRSWPLTSI